MTQYAVESSTKKIEELLSYKHYGIDPSYQRNYAWTETQVDELLSDLTTKFFESYVPGHSRQEGSKYSSYFLGVVHLAHNDGTIYIIDGQQRLTTLTLLLFYLHNQQRQRGRQGDPDLTPLLWTARRGKTTFNLDVSEHLDVFEALKKGSIPDVDSESMPR